MADYLDDDFVYVDTETRKVIGLVKWDKNGCPIQLERKPAKDEGLDEDSEEKQDKKKKKGKNKKYYYPWGSYRTMKKIYRIEGKVKDADRSDGFDEILERSLKEAYWD